MPSLLELWNRLRDRIRRDQLSAELDEEIEFHRRSLGQDGSRRFGNATLHKEAARAAWSVGRADVALDDITAATRHALRSLRRAPTFALAVILTFGVGIGATTAVFSVVSAALLEPLPYANARRIVAIQQTRRSDPISVSIPDLMDFRAQSSTLTEVAGFVSTTLVVNGDGEPERLRGQIITSNLFRTLGVQPMLGRAFTAEEELAGGAPVVTLSYDLWMRRYAGDRGIIGRMLSFSGEKFAVAGVMPPGFRFPDGIVFGPADLWLPFSRIAADDRTGRDNHAGVVAVGLLRPGATLAAARTELTGIAARLTAQYPQSNREVGVKVDDVVDVIVGSLRDSLTLLLVAVALVLVIACANVAGLVVTRADARRVELAVKAALGATRWRMVANLIAEGAILAVLGGAVGVGAATLFVRAFAASVADLPRLEHLALDWRAVTVALVITIFAGLASSISPALWAGRRELDRWLRVRRGDSRSGSGTRLRDALVIAEIALSLVLFAVSALLLRSFERMRAETGGIDARGVLTFTVTAPDSAYTSPAATTALIEQIVDGIAARPGVTHTGAINILPFSGAGGQSGIGPQGTGRDGERRTDVHVATPDYFRALGIELVQGRTFTSSDRPDTPPVGVVDEWLARAFFPNEPAVGKHIAGWGFRDIEIVGVVRHVTSYGVAAESRQQLYVAHAHRPVRRMRFVVRTTGDPSSLTSAVRAVVSGLDRNLPIYDVQTMENVVARTVSGPRLAAFLSTAYSSIALVLVVIGIYGVMAFLVLRRTHEIGVRIALGAGSADIVAMVTRGVLRLAGVGIALGLIGAVIGSRLIRTLLFGVGSTDPVTFGVAVAAILIAVALAGAIPALRATRVSPLVALNDDR